MNVRHAVWVLACCLWPATLSAQAEVETFQYTVQEGDTCVGIARRFFNDRNRYDLIHAYNPNMGPPPHDLQAGTVLTLPRSAVDAESTPAAHVTDVRRDVRANEPRDPDWHPAERGLGLFGGWRVNTLESSAAELTFRDTSVIQMRANTLVVIFGDTATRARRRSTRAELRNGTLRSRLGTLRMEVDMPAGQAQLAGGSSVVGVDGEGTTRVSHHEGSPVVLNGEGGGRVRVPPGNGSKVQRGRRPTRPRPLPDAPTWRRSSDAFVGLADGATIRGGWEPVEDARVYRVEVLREERVFAAIEVPENVTEYEMHGLPAGHYEIRVSTIDGDFFESRPSQPRTVDVSLIDVRSPGATAVDERAAPDPSMPRTEPMLLVGTEIVPPEGTTCALAAEGETVTRLTASGTQTLHCRQGDTLLEPFPVQVVAPELASSDSGTEPTMVYAGRLTTVRLEVSSALPLPENLDLRGEGVEIREVRRGDDGSYELDLVATEVAEETEGVVELHLGDVVLARHPVLVHPPSVEPPPEPEPEPEGPRAVHPQEALATFGHPAMFSLRDPAPPALRASLGVGMTRTDADETVATMGIFLDTAIGSRVRLHVQYSQALTDDAESRGGVESAFTGLGAVILDSDVQLRGELAAWWPTGPADDHVRLAPAFDLGVPLLDRQLLLRTRQGALLDVTGDGPMLWASAYGIDGRVGPLSFGLEVDASIGKDQLTGELLTPLAAALVLSLDVGPVSLGLAAQRALTRDFERLRGPWRAQLTVGVDFDRLGR
ncbi:MAG: LysM peptidoglycan-binding domain-containing protein [Deltaproteobacteria bacterium]|nr:LysM peptidoglycan-binding domain-containing protein [Deltaproteobacteria bacterium]